jgi:phenylpropionate dioxygenase-like ring-hydroxylating dioxygenase large terminal subunit/AcrR family transcriptional regulator
MEEWTACHNAATGSIGTGRMLIQNTEWPLKRIGARFRLWLLNTGELRMAQSQIDYSVPNERRRLLIEATMSVIAEHGFSGVTLAKVAGLAGLTASSVNFHFDSKAALLLATLQRVAEEFSTRMNLTVERARANAADRLRAVIDVSLDPELTEYRKVAVWYAFVSEATARADYQLICGQWDREYYDIVYSLCRELIGEAGLADRMNVPAITRALTGLVNELWQEILFAGDGYDRNAAKDQCLAFLASLFPAQFDMPGKVQEEREPLAPREADGLVYTLPAWCYSSGTFFELEKERLFIPAWQLVCHANDLSEVGSYVTFEFLEKRAFVIRVSMDRLAAFHNVCPHRAHSLVIGDAGRCPGRVTCPYHGWTFDYQGNRIAIGAPDSFRPHSPGHFGLDQVECEVYRGFVFIRFQPGGVSVAEQFEPVDEEFGCYRTEQMQWASNRMESEGFWTETVEADWKNVVENYLEDYHFPTGHKGLSGLMKKSYDRNAYPNGLARLSHELRDKPRSGWSVARYHRILPEYEHLPEKMRRRWTYFAAFPATFFDLFPDKMDFFQVLPIGPGRSRLRGRSYALPDDSRRGRAARYLGDRINMRVQAEDNRLIREVQKGLISGSYEYGILSDKEVLVRHFQDWVREHIPAATRRKAP